MQKAARNKNLYVIFAVTLMAVLGVSSIAPVLPLMAKEFGATANQASLLLSIFALPGIFAMPFLGFLSDRFGRKKVLIPSLVLFSTAGCLCAVSPDFRVLLFFRFLQGLGAASLGMVNLTLIGDLFKGPQRIEAMGLNGAVLSAGTALYPALGGFLAASNWRYPFLLPVLALPVAFFVGAYLKEPDRLPSEKLKDYLSDTFRILSNRRTLALFTGILTAFIIIYGVSLTLFPFFMQATFASSPKTIGLYLSLMSAGTILAAWKLRALAELAGEKRLILSGFGLYILACLVFPSLTSLAPVAALAVLLGFAHGINVPTISGLLTETAPAKNRAGVMSFNGIFLRLGQTVGPVLMAWIYNAAGGTQAFFVGALLSLAALVIIKSISLK